MLDLYKNIKRLRKENNWSQEELAKRMGYTDRSTIAKIESGRVDLPQSKILDFARVFGIDAGDLMGNDGIVTPEEEERARRIRELYASVPTEVLEDAETDSQLKEVISLFLNGNEADRETYLRILRGLQQNP